MSLRPFITYVSYDAVLVGERVLVWATEDQEAARKALAHREESSDDGDDEAEAESNDQPKRPVRVGVFALRQLSPGEERCVTLPGDDGSAETEIDMLLDLFVEDPVVITIDG